MVLESVFSLGSQPHARKFMRLWSRLGYSNPDPSPTGTCNSSHHAYGRSAIPLTFAPLTKDGGSRAVGLPIPNRKGALTVHTLFAQAASIHPSVMFAFHKKRPNVALCNSCWLKYYCRHHGFLEPFANFIHEFAFASAFN